VPVASAVGCAKDKRMIDAVYATSEPHNDVVIAVQIAHRTLGALKRSEGMIDGTVGGIISRGRDCNRNRRSPVRLRNHARNT